MSLERGWCNPRRGPDPLPIRIVAVDHELGLGAAAELVQIHADAFAIVVGAEGDYAVEGPEDQADEREHQAEQGGDANQLGNELAGLRSEGASGDESPEA